MLQVKFAACTFRSRNQGDGNHSQPGLLLDIYHSLREIFTLDVVGISLKRVLAMSLSSSSPPPLVRIVIITEWMFCSPCDPDFGSFMPRFYEVHDPWPSCNA